MTPLRYNVDSAHGGAGWLPRRDDAMNSSVSYTVCHDGDNLGAVLLHQPGLHLNEIQDAASVDWTAPISIERARDEIAQLAEIYTSHGVEVHFFSPANPMPNHVFMRDLFTITSGGAIVSRMASEKRAGEEVELTACLANLKIPIVKSIRSPGVFEGPDIVFFDDGHAFVGEGIRSNQEGMEQVTVELEGQGVDVTRIQTTFGCGHLDGVLSIANRKTAVLFPRRVSYTVYDKLRRHGYNIVVIEDEREADDCMAINLVSLNQETVVMNSRAISLRKQLEAAGVKVITHDVNEVMNGGGALHCVTGILARGGSV